ncbi:OmpA family protein [Fluviicola sp.]|uniref:OmpA family protein n=1 Tax=Fluviicola sp. TaxID=1917219 RepID=UPI003D2884E0
MKERANLALTASLILMVITVCFGFNSSVLDNRGQQVLDKFVTQLDSFSDYRINLNGNTDDIGSDSYNEKLSKERAIAVRNYLISKNVDSSKITIDYSGEHKPTVPNTSEENRALNRRVDVAISGEKIKNFQPEIPKQDTVILQKRVDKAISPIQKETKITSSEVHKKKKVRRRLVWTGWRTGFHWSTSGK